MEKYSDKGKKRFLRQWARCAPKERRHKKRNKKYQHVKLRRLNWDVEFYTDMNNGKGFIISEPAEISLDGEKKKTLYGPQSPLYGTTYGDDQAFIERYRCSCGAFKSRLFEGETCPICNTKVTYKDADINTTGWIVLGHNFVINPYYFNLLCQTLGKKVFTDIVYAKYKVTKDGNHLLPTKEDLDEEPSSPYYGIGLTKFFENYYEILMYFKKKKKNKEKIIDYLIRKKRYVFTSHIPIYSTLLRPQSVTSDTFYYGSMDKLVNTMFSLSENLKNCQPIEKDYILYRLQKKLTAMWDIGFD